MLLAILQLPDSDLRAIAERARGRTLDEHTGERRAAELLAYCEEAYRRKHAARR